MLFLFFTTILACSDSAQDPLPLNQTVDLRQTVRVETVQKQMLSQDLVLPTTLEGEKSAILVPKVQGRIADVFVRVGDEVQAGTALLKIEDSDYNAAYQESKMAMRLVEVQMEQANLNLSRFQKLLTQKAVTRSQYEEVETGAKLAEGQYNRAKIGWEIAGNRLQETTLRAPFDGTIIARTVETGEMLGGNIQQPPLMISALKTVRFKASIGESTIPSVTKESKASLQVLNHEPFVVQISRINAAVDPITNTVEIEGTFDNSQYQFLHGQSAQLLIANTQEIIAINRKALLNRKDQTADVFVLLSDDTVQKKNIRYGRSNQGLVPVLSGLLEGDQILVAGHSRLKDGDSVIVARDF